MAVTLGDIAMGNGRHNEFHQFGADDVNKAIYAGQTLGDLAERNRERARQQSVRNLIGQRMKEGYDWTQLGAEAAQFSPETARTMDNQFMQEGTWQRNENVENLKQFREEMTRRKFSEALNTFMQGGYAISREEFMTMCERAAANVAMYDANLAKELLQWIKSEIDAGALDRQRRDIAEAKKNGNKFNDLVSIAQKARFAAKDVDSKDAPSIYYGLRNYAVAAEVVADLEAERGVPAEKNDVLRLYQLLNSREREDIARESYKKAAIDSGFKLINEGNGEVEPAVDNTITEDIIDKVEGFDLGIDKPQLQDPSVNKNPVGKYSIQNNSLRNADGTLNIRSMVKRSENSGWIDKELFDSYLKECSTEDELNALETRITEDVASVHTKEGSDSAGIRNTYSKQIEAKRKTINELSKDGIPYNRATKVLLDKMPARANASNIRRLRQAGTAAAGLISTTPWSIMDNLIMVQSPDFAPTNAMQGTAAQVLDGNLWQSAITSFQNSGNSFAANLAKNSNVWKALESGARDLLNTIRPMYKEMLANCETEQEKAALKSMLSSTTYGWPPQLFDALEDEKYGSLGKADEIEKRAKSLKDKPVNQYFADEVVTKEGKTVKRNDKETSSKPSNESSRSPKVMSAKEWLARRRAQKEGR